jgi:hypothetical protein
MFQIKLVSFTSIYVILLHEDMIVCRAGEGKYKQILELLIVPQRREVTLKVLSIQQ